MTDLNETHYYCSSYATTTTSTAIIEIALQPENKIPNTLTFVFKVQIIIFFFSFVQQKKNIQYVDSYLFNIVR